MKSTDNVKKWRSLDDKKIQIELNDLKKKLATETLQVRAGKLENYSQIGKTKRDIARIETIISERNWSE